MPTHNLKASCRPHVRHARQHSSVPDQTMCSSTELALWEYLPRLSITSWALTVLTSDMFHTRSIDNATTICVAWTRGVLNHWNKLFGDLSIVITFETWEPDNIHMVTSHRMWTRHRTGEIQWAEAETWRNGPQAVHEPR